MRVSYVKMKKYLRLTVGITISAFFLWLVIKDIDFRNVLDSLGKFNLPLLLLGLAIWLVGYLIRGFRWQYFLAHIKKINFWTSFKVLVIGFAGNNLLPLRAGEVIRAYFLGQNQDISKSSVLATIGAERVFDGFAIIFLMLVGARSLTMPDWVSYAIEFSFLLFVAAMAFFVLMVMREDWFSRFAKFVFGLFPQSLGSRLENILEHFIHGLKFLRSPVALTKIIVLTFVIWTIEASFYYIAALSFAFPLNFFKALFLMGVINLGVLIPSSPGYVGTFEFFAVKTLALFGVGNEAALAYALIVHLCQHLPISVMGILFTSQMGGSLFGVKKADKLTFP